MNTIKKSAGLLLFAALVFFASGVAESQVTILKDKGETRTFMAGQLSVARDISSVENKAFVCTILTPLKKDDTIAAMVSEDQAWSMHKQALDVGKQKIEFSVMASAKSKDGAFHTFFPAWMEFKINVKAGETVHTNGFQIRTKRPIKAGDRIPVILVGLSSMLSVESEAGSRDANMPPLPWLTVHKDDLDANARSSAIDIWRLAKEHAGK
ncbi:MAG: hypothetical protein A2520_11080 [Deltaproteobacteria bacterium RIFOXYD12_FULL_53_23]|nr:MAG: hypothetical protein A2520_11080 [Deltaproteobacteria bacterium RIFOXYD12_FULL_53_23]